MASLQQEGNGWYCQFLHHGKRHTFADGAEEAKAKAAQVDYLLLRLKQRLIDQPPGVGIVEFVRHDGKPYRLFSARGRGQDAQLARLPRPLPSHEAPDLKGVEHESAF